MTVTSYAYRGEVDREPLLDLLRAGRTTDTLDDYPTAADMRELLSIPVIDPQSNLRLWQDAGQLVGYGMVQLPSGNLLFSTLPSTQTTVWGQIIAWAVERAQALKTRRDSLEVLDAYSRSDDTVRMAVLEHHGFVRQDSCTYTMDRSLDDILPVYALPEGWAVRVLAGPAEVADYVACIRQRSTRAI